MKRPAFQFYPGDWQKNAKLRRCSPAARGVWMDILCLLHDSDEYGVLRWPLKDIANAAGASMALVRELVSKGVLKGADKDAEPYVYRANHAGKLGEPVVLALPDGGPIWYSSRFVRDEWVRQKRGESTRFDTANQPGRRSPKGGFGEREGDGPSTSSSSSNSEAIASAGAGAPPVDNSKPEPEDEAKVRRQLWQDSGRWLQSNGLTAGDAKAFLNTVAKEHPATVAQAVQEAMKTDAPVDPKAWVQGIAKRLDGERTKPITVPSQAAEQTADYLRQQAERGAVTPSPAALAALNAVRAVIA